MSHHSLESSRRMGKTAKRWTRWAVAMPAWLVIVLGVFHMAATWRFYRELTPAALWFFNAGIVLVFTGALNLVAYRAGQVASVRWFCRCVNVVMTCFAAVSGVVSGGSTASLVVVLAVMGALTLLSFTSLH